MLRHVWPEGDAVAPLCNGLLAFEHDCVLVFVFYILVRAPSLSIQQSYDAEAGPQASAIARWKLNSVMLSSISFAFDGKWVCFSLCINVVDSLAIFSLWKSDLIPDRRKIFISSQFITRLNNQL